MVGIAVKMLMTWWLGDCTGVAQRAGTSKAFVKWGGAMRTNWKPWLIDGFYRWFTPSNMVIFHRFLYVYWVELGEKHRSFAMNFFGLLVRITFWKVPKGSGSQWTQLSSVATFGFPKAQKYHVKNGWKRWLPWDSVGWMGFLPWISTQFPDRYNVRPPRYKLVYKPQ